MGNIARIMKRHVKSALHRMGIQQQTLEAIRIFDPRNQRYRSEKTFVANLDGVEVSFNADDSYSNRWFYPRYAGGGIHERKVTEMLVESLRGTRCFADVGTNLGWYTCIASKCLPQGIVYGFEMDDLNFGLLQKNLALNHATNVEAHLAAISDSEGTVSYERSGSNPSPFFQMQGGNPRRTSKTVSVQSITLDQFFDDIKTPPDVIKIDVEGAEFSVLKGMTRILREHKPTLFLEIHPTYLKKFGASTRELLTLLIEIGYRVVQIESMREDESALQLTPLTPHSVIESNDMLYAVHESSCVCHESSSASGIPV